MQPLNQLYMKQLKEIEEEEEDEDEERNTWLGDVAII